MPTSSRNSSAARLRRGRIAAAAEPVDAEPVDDGPVDAGPAGNDEVAAVPEPSPTGEPSPTTPPSRGIRQSGPQPIAITPAARLLELATGLLDHHSLQAAADDLAARLAELFDARSVAVGRVRGRGPQVRVLAQSGRSELRTDSDLSTSLAAAMAETALHGQTLWTRQVLGEPTAPGHTPLADRTGAIVIVAAAAEDDPLLVITVIDPPPDRIDEVRAVLAAAGGPLDAVFRTVGVASRSLRNRLVRAIRHRHTLARTVAAASALSLLTGLALLPVPYRMAAECELQPVVRRLVVAPHEGLVERSLVEPGDVVAAGQPLAEMDGRDLRWERIGLQADQSRAIRQRDAALARQEISEAQKAELERLSIAAQLETLARRESELQVAAPIDGQVLAAAIERGSSQSVGIGQTLFEVGTISPLRVEVGVPSDLWPYVREGQPVEVELDGRPGQMQTATVVRVRPQVESRDGRHVLLVDAELPNADRRLHPGTRGTARVVGDRQPLAWTLLHRPYESLRRWLW